MNGLLILDPWIGLILQGLKTWEMRSKPTAIRGPVGLIRSGTGLVVGTAELVDSKPPLVREDYMRWRDQHHIPETMLDEVISRRWVYPWVLESIRVLPEPMAYRHNSATVTLVKLRPEIVERLRNVSGMSAAHSTATAEKPSAPVRSPAASSEEHQRSVDKIEHTQGVSVFRAECALAYGRPLAGGDFLITAGSTAMREGSPNVKRDSTFRDDLVSSGVLVPDHDRRLYRFSRDHVFSSVSRASGVVKDGNASGPTLWKHVETGVTLKDWLKRSPPGQTSK